jgi:glycosyltransferase involved in cell wall biosynthesis
MNIFYDHQIFTMQKYGGISRYFYELISRLCQEVGVDVSLFLGFSINEYGLESYCSRFSSFWGYKHRDIPKTIRFFSSLNNTLFRYFTRASATADIYHPTYYKNPARGFKGKKVLTVHDMIHELYPHFLPQKEINTARDKKQAIRNADAIICVSQSTQRDLIRYFDVPEKKIKVIYHGNSLKQEIVSQRLVDSPYILYVGKRGGYKNFELLLNAYARLEKVRYDFKLICFGGEQFTFHELELIKSLHLGDSVLSYSGVDETLANLYQYASVFVYPSLYEGFGMPPLEAMHYGCPVLVSNSSSIPEIVGQAGLYFNPVDLEELTDKLYTILHDTTMREQLIQAGLTQEGKFSWDRCARETLAFYREIST